MKVKIWILASDSNKGGTESDVYTSEAALNETLKQIMEEASKEDAELKALIDEGDIDDAWDRWDENHRPIMDTYSVEEREIEVDVPILGELVACCEELLEICRWKCSPTDEVILKAVKTNHQALVEASQLLAKIKEAK